MGCALPLVLFDVTVMSLLPDEATTATMPPTGVFCAPPVVPPIEPPCATAPADETLMACAALRDVMPVGS